MIIAVSIPAHEKPKVINNEISNIKKYINNVIIVLHLSTDFYHNYSEKDINQERNVYINNIHNEIKWGDISKAHISNYLFLKQLNIQYDYMLFHASNDMYIKDGIELYIREYQAGFFKHYIKSSETMWWPGNCAFKDEQLKNLIKAINGSIMVGSQIEGTFYKHSLLDIIINIINENYDYNKSDIVYPREEILFPTIANTLLEEKDIGFPTTYSEVHYYDAVLWRFQMIGRQLFLKDECSERRKEIYKWFEDKFMMILLKSKFYKLRKSTILKIKKNIDIGKRKYLYDGQTTTQLYDGHFFSVKRVERDLNNRIRRYIDSL